MGWISLLGLFFSFWSQVELRCYSSARVNVLKLMSVKSAESGKDTESGCLI